MFRLNGAHEKNLPTSKKQSLTNRSTRISAYERELTTENELTFNLVASTMLTQMVYTPYTIHREQQKKEIYVMSAKTVFVLNTTSQKLSTIFFVLTFKTNYSYSFYCCQGQWMNIKSFNCICLRVICRYINEICIEAERNKDN